MAKEICISTTPHETRLAILEDDQLAEIYYERENEYTLAGSIYKGRVTRVLPGMQSSFVDVGLERDAFLYVTDFLEEQEDSEEYASEGVRREGRASRPEVGDESRTEGERNGGERGPGRGERNPERGQDRDRGRRPSAGVAPQVEASREPGREGGRGGRERAREQAIAPLREAAPAAQDLEEKGDEESPAGTRRWRGRRGRRRGVRGGLAQAGAQPASGAAAQVEPETGEENGEFEETIEASFAEHGAPGGTALVAQPVSPAPVVQDRQPRRHEGGRDRGSRRSREPYAQASTLERPVREAEARQPARVENAAAVSAIVLPGESLSKYGSVPAEAGAAPVTASAPQAAARPVNYVAPKPSTLVELSGDWDGGALLPGETISRYRESAGGRVSSLPVSQAHVSGEGNLDAVAEAFPEPAGTADHATLAADGEPQVERQGEADAELWSQVESPASDTGDAEALEHLGEHADEAGRTLAPVVEPEIVSAAISPEAEAGAPLVVEPEIVHTAEADSQEVAQGGEYEPEHASASYRVNPVGASEMRLASPEDEVEEKISASAADAGQLQEGLASAELPAEPTGSFADAEAAPVLEFAGELTAAPDVQHEAEHVSGEEFTAEQVSEPVAWPERPEHGAQTAEVPSVPILHQDGTIDLAAAYDNDAMARANAEQAAWAQGFEAEPTHDAGALADPHDRAHEDEGSATASVLHSTEFSDLVDRLQGFSPGHGLLEEETIDEDEYDFEPLHAHAHTEEGDQEDLEEETLDQRMEPSVIGEAVRESHLEQRVRVEEEAPENSARADLATSEVSAAAEREEVSLGYEEVDEAEEDDEEFEDEGEEAAHDAQTAEGQRQGRSDESRGRGRGRSSGGRGSDGRNGGRRNGGSGRGRSAQTQDLPIITDLLKQGQEILVQIAKEPIAKKGARITSHIALPGRFLVFMPTVSHVGVSRKIASDEERQRLKRILISEKGDSSGGFIVRTAAEGATEEDLRADLRFLISLWTEIKQRSDTAKAPALIYHDLNLIERILRDQVSSNFATIWVDSEAEYERIIRFLSRFQPQLVRRVKLYTKETPLFEHFGIQEEISKALKSKVWLKSGGSIVINQTEALVAIDINTGKYVGKTSRLEDTIVKTNLDAIPEIVRQIRLRDLGGIIVIDFIDMDERKNRNRVLAALEEELKNDRAPSKVLQFNDFGLVAITRKRVKQSLERTLSVTCETCTGTGMVKSPITVCNEIYTEMRKMLKHLDGKDAMLRVHPEVVKQLKANNGKWINELEELAGKTIIIKSDAALHPEQFDIH